MQQKQIQVGNKKLLALDIPEDINKAEIINGNIVYSNGKSGRAIMYHNPDLKVIGFKNDITEEQWAEIVEKIQLYHHIVYENYMNQSLDATFKTAKESGLSLLQANNIDYLNCLIIQVI